MTTPAMRENHEQHSQRLMAHAKAQLAAGDLLQASEKAWGGFAHKAKAVAYQRDWRYRRHLQINNIIHALSQESEDLELVACSSLAQGLHVNFYENWYLLPQIAAVQKVVERGIAKLEAIAQRYDTDPAYRRRADALNPPGRTPPRPPGTGVNQIITAYPDRRRRRRRNRNRNGNGNGGNPNGGNPQSQ